MKRLHRKIIQAAILSSLVFTFIALNASLSLSQQTQETFAQTSAARRGADSVMLSVTVTDRQRNYVKGLTQANFTISDGKQEQQINAFNSNDVPLSVGIVVDTSGSIEKQSLKPMRDALSKFFQLSNEKNEYFLISFDTKPKLLQDWTTDAASVLKQVGVGPRNGATALYDTCYVAVEKLTRGRYRKQALILISDGADSISEYSYAELKRSLEESDALFYCIRIPGGNLNSSLGINSQNVIDELAATTGGVVYYPDGAQEISNAFELIATELRNQYLIGFTPTANDKKRHGLKVRVTPPSNAPRDMQKLNVRSRKNFYAQARQP